MEGDICQADYWWYTRPSSAEGTQDRSLPSGLSRMVKITLHLPSPLNTNGNDNRFCHVKYGVLTTHEENNILKISSQSGYLIAVR